MRRSRLQTTDCTERKGPGVIIGQDGTVTFVRHGGVHRSRLWKVRHDEDKQTAQDHPDRKADSDKVNANNAAFISVNTDDGRDNISDRGGEYKRSVALAN